MARKVIVVDLDGTICEELPTFERYAARPLPDAKRRLEALRLAGYRILVYTARSWPEYQMTYDWLRDHEMPFDLLICGKPVAYRWVDDRSVRTLEEAVADL